MLYDISRTLRSDIAVWPGDTPFSLQRQLALTNGDSVNLSTLTMSAHTGSHVDAPYHFAADGRTMAAVSLAPYWGLAQVVTVRGAPRPLEPADLAHVALDAAPRLLLHTSASDLDPTLFPRDICYPTPALADFLAAHAIVLLGSDAPSMDDVDSPTLPGHNALRRQEIAILEGLLFQGVPDGLYEMVALPLKIEGGDGSPVRAVLRQLPTTRDG